MSSTQILFNDPYDSSINTKDNKNDSNPLDNATYLHLPDEPEVEEEDYFYDAHYSTATEDNLNKIHPDINHNLSYSTMNSGVMEMYHRDIDT